MRKESDSTRVVVVATPGVRLFELSVPCEVFGTDRSDLAAHWYEFELVASSDDVWTDAGLPVPAGRGLRACAEADTVVVPACTSVHRRAPDRVLDAIRKAHARGARIVALCSGAFILAQAGLLDGRRAATHWMHADEMSARHPGVSVDANSLYVHDHVWTSAGSAAALDLCLELVRQDHGTAVANEVARRIVIPPHRSGGQAQYVRPRPVATRDAHLAEVFAWTRDNLASATVGAMAERASMSPRTLHRTLHSVTGSSPQDWLQRERLTAAQELLETTDLTVATVAHRCGFGTTTNLRAQFTAAFDVPPSGYRATFTARSG